VLIRAVKPGRRCDMLEVTIHEAAEEGKYIVRIERGNTKLTYLAQDLDHALSMVHEFLTA